GLLRSTAVTSLVMVPTTSRLPRTAADAPTWPFSAPPPATSSLPVAVSIRCRVLSQPAANVLPPATAGVPMTGPPATWNFHFGLPSATFRQGSGSAVVPDKAAAAGD